MFPGSWCKYWGDHSIQKSLTYIHTALFYLQILHKSAGVVSVLIHNWRDPDVTVITQYDTSAARKIVEMRLPSLHQRRRDLHQCTPTQLENTQEI